MARVHVGIEDVARRAGVSTATVSRAMRGLPNVAPATRMQVLSVAKSLGYVPSPSAVSLASGRTRAVSLICPSITRWFFAEVIEGTELALRRAGLDVLLHTLESRHAIPRARFEPEVLRGRIDAALVCGMSLGESEAQGLRDLGRPVVFVSVEQPGFACILIDDRAASRTATRHLIDLGHRHIAHLGGGGAFNEPWSPLTARRGGWEAELADAGLAAPSEYDVPGYFDLELSRKAVHELLRAHPEVTAIQADSDEMAMGAMRAARDLGLDVPGDLSVVGFDGHELCEMLGLTTIEQPARQQGELAATMLLTGMDPLTPLPRSTVRVPSALVARSSTGPVRADRRLQLA